MIIERQYQVSQGHSIANADQQQFSDGQSPHPILADKAQFAGAEENNPFAETDNNQERKNELQLRKTNELAPAPSVVATPTLTRT